MVEALATDHGLADYEIAIVPTGEEAPPRLFGPGWGTGESAQAGQDAALALAGLSLDDLPCP